MKRTIRIILEPEGAGVNNELWKAIYTMITFWNLGNTDKLGNLTIWVMTTEEHLEELKTFLIDKDNKNKFGIIQSGLVENNVFVGWPKKKNEEPKVFTAMASPSTIDKKLTKKPIRLFFERLFHFKFSPKG